MRRESAKSVEVIVRVETRRPPKTYTVDPTRVMEHPT